MRGFGHACHRVSRLFREGSLATAMQSAHSTPLLSHTLLSHPPPLPPPAFLRAVSCRMSDGGGGVCGCCTPPPQKPSALRCRSFWVFILEAHQAICHSHRSSRRKGKSAPNNGCRFQHQAVHWLVRIARRFMRACICACETRLSVCTLLLEGGAAAMKRSRAEGRRVGRGWRSKSMSLNSSSALNRLSHHLQLP
jgi:hypothetical protein